MDTDNESMKVYFEKYGQINDSVVMRDGETQKSRGFGFVTFSDISQATVCINDKPHLLQEKEVSSWSRDLGYRAWRLDPG